MEITTRAFWTAVHGMGFGALYLLGCSGLLVELRHRFAPRAGSQAAGDGSVLKWYLLAMSILAWLAVLTGTYVVYPWYRATPPAGVSNLAAFPQRLLLSHPATAGWHSLGMEWKEHAAWIAPVAITTAAGVVFRYGQDLRHHPRLRSAIMTLVLFSLASAGLAGFWGATINKYAPVSGGSSLQLLKPAVQR